MNEFELALERMLGDKRLELIQGIKVGIAGCGGLGSNCAFNLVRSGFKHLVLADFDKIEYSNLNRQFFFYDQVGSYKSETLAKNLLRINPDLNLTVFKDELCSESILNLYSECDVVVEAFDLASMKKLLVESLSQTDKLLVSASGLAGWDSADKIVTRKISDKLYLVGDMVTEANEVTPPLSPRVNVAAAKQANVILSQVLSSLEVE